MIRCSFLQEERSKINNVSFLLKKLEKKEQTISKPIRKEILIWKEIENKKAKREIKLKAISLKVVANVLLSSQVNHTKMEET